MHWKPRHFIICLSSLISACQNYQGDWPSLADPIAPPEERVRIIERIPVPHETANLTHNVSFTDIAEARTALTQLQATLASAKNDYEMQANVLIQPAEDDENAWFNAQFLLTRLSHTASRLDSFLQNRTNNQQSSEWESFFTTVENALEIYENYIVDARKTLKQNTPASYK